MLFEQKVSSYWWRAGTLAIAVIVLGGVSSCGKAKKSKATMATDSSLSQLGDGTWVGSCELDEAGKSSKSEFVVSGSSATSTIRLYSDANCATESSVSEFHISFSLGGAAASPAGALEYQQNVSKIIMTLKTADGVSMANDGLKFGDQVIFPPICNGGFTINVPRELNPTNCAGDLIYGSMDSTRYGIFKVDGDKLYFGEPDEDHDGSTAAKRPTKLESTYYTKQTSGGGNGGGTTGSTTGGTTGSTTGTTTGGAPESSVSLAGNWVSACGLSDEQQGVWVQDTLEFTEDAFTWTQRSYSDGNCLTQSGSASLAGTYTIGAQVPSLPGTYELDAVISQSGYFDIVKVDGDKLYMGEDSAELDGSIPDKRPMALGQGYYQKQP